MKSIYLIRHTKPAVEKGTCYGQTDIDITESFELEAGIIREHLPESIERIYSSPLQRCRKLANRLFPSSEIEYIDALMEIHCGIWEMKRWDDLPREELDSWMNDFVQVRIPGGESYMDLYNRVIAFYKQTLKEDKDIAFLTHGGVIRSILSYITETPLKDSFGRFAVYYGAVVRIDVDQGRQIHHLLSNIAPAEKEQHKPSSK